MKIIHSIEYDTPGGKLSFPAGSGGMVNSNVLYMTKAISQKEKNMYDLLDSRFVMYYTVLVYIIR